MSISKSIKILGIILVILFTCLITLALLITDNRPIVSETSKVTPQALAETKKLLKQINSQLKSSGQTKTISIPYHTLDAMFSLASDILFDLSARYNDLGNILLISVSIKLPENPFGQFINVSTYLSNDYFDSETSKTDIGKMSFNNSTLINILSKILFLFVDQDLIPENGELIQKIKIENSAIHILIQPRLNTAQLLNSIKTAGKDAASHYLKSAEFKHVQIYYDHLISSTKYTINSTIAVSLFDYIKLAMDMAYLRSDLSNAKDENTSAVIALALFVGDENLKKSLNSLLNIKLKPNVRLRTKLINRQDLMLHFIYSAIIQIMTNNGISFSIGELKEISDSQKGGSGFSFVDIAADRTGIKFAEMATVNHSNARLLQQRMGYASSESDIFPDIFALKENISEKQFDQLYKSRQSDEYKSIINEIDRRIETLVIFKK